jgi:hypothetical protein
MLRARYVSPPFFTEHEDVYVASMLSARIGDDHYLGACRPSPTWPGMPRATEAFSTQCRPSICASTASTGSPHGPVLWMRGDSDLIVSDTSAYDLADQGR